MKRLEVFLLPPGRDASSLQGLPREINLPVPNTPTCTVGEEAPWEQSVLSKNIMHWLQPGLKPGLLGVQCTNQYITMAMFTVGARVWFSLALMCMDILYLGTRWYMYLGFWSMPCLNTTIFCAGDQAPCVNTANSMLPWCPLPGWDYN